MFKRKIKIMIKRFFLLLMPLLVAAGCGHRAEKAQSTKSVLVAEAQSVDGNQIISFPGRAKAVEEINLSFRISGPIAKILLRAEMCWQLWTTGITRLSSLQFRQSMTA